MFMVYGLAGPLGGYRVRVFIDRKSDCSDELSFSCRHVLFMFCGLHYTNDVYVSWASHWVILFWSFQ